MIKYVNGKGYRVRESEKYRTTFLLDNDTNIIKFVQNIQELDDYRIVIVELGSYEMNTEPKQIILYGDAAKEIYNSFMNRVQA